MPILKLLIFLSVQDITEQERDGEHIIFCDVMLSNDEGERYVQGTAQGTALGTLLSRAV